MTIIEENLKTAESINNTDYYKLITHKVFEYETKKNKKIEQLLIMEIQLNGSKLITNEETHRRLILSLVFWEKI